MGIVNVGSDSVADGRSLRGLAAQVAAAVQQQEAGAHLVDVGVESGRTDTQMLPEEQEAAHLRPLVAALTEEGIIVSVDTWRPRVVEAVLDAGAAMINDVSGLADVGVAKLAAAYGAALVVMHTRAGPKTEYFPGYDDPIADVLRLLEQRLALALAHGVAREQLIVDPGLDFAKTPAESIAVLRRLVELRQFDRPILLAVSRKYFIGMVTGKGPEQRLAGTLAAVDFGVGAGADILRVHDVAEVVEYLRVRATLNGSDDPELRGDPQDESLKWLPPKR